MNTLLLETIRYAMLCYIYYIGLLHYLTQLCLWMCGSFILSAPTHTKDFACLLQTILEIPNISIISMLQLPKPKKATFNFFSIFFLNVCC